MSLFITFEGGEGCGKSTQARMLFEKLLELALPVVFTHEPGGTSLGEQLSKCLKWTQDAGISPLAELLLFNASRSELVIEVIRPSLTDGKLVISDRYADSTTAYQSYGRGLDLEMVTDINHAAIQGLKPDVTFLLDISVEEGLARKGNARQDRFEQEELGFHRRVREGYLKMAADESERWLVVDAVQPKEKIQEIVWQRVSQLLSERGLKYE